MSLRSRLLGLDRRSLSIAALLPLFSVMDVMLLSGVVPEALGFRIAWSLELVLHALLLQRSSEAGRSLLILANSALSSCFYLGIVTATGLLDSPYVHLLPSMPLLVAFIYPEDMRTAVASGLVSLVGIAVLGSVLQGDPRRALAWASLVAVATFFGVYGSARFRDALEARNALLVERARREDLERLARTQRQQAQSERLATVGRLAASVMHEINNPLAYVRSNLSFFQTELRAQPLAPEVRAEFEQVLAETHAGLERIRQIAADLKGFSRMDEEQAGECALADAVADAVRLAGVRLKHVARVEVDVPRELPCVHVTPRRLVQVLLNLLVNAGDAIEDAGRAGGLIRVRGERGEGRVVLLVEDNGPGFPPQVLARLFESFFTTKSPEKGTGLGLVISRELLEPFGATLVAENRAEGGARLRIELPLHAPGPRAPS